MIIACEELTDFPALPSIGDIVNVYNPSLGYDGVFVYAPAEPTALPNGWVLCRTGPQLRENERVVDAVVRTRYPGRDYQTFMDEILANLKANYQSVYTDFTTSAPGMMIVRFICDALDMMSWNMDQRATENFLYLAILRASVGRIVRALGYKPGRATASSVDLDLTLTSGPYAFPVLVRAGYKFVGPRGLVFQQVGDVLYNPGETVKTTVPYTQIETLSVKYNSTGAARQRFELRSIDTGKYVAQGSLVVYVNGELWTETDFLPFDSLNQYEVNYEAEPPYVKFGDGIVGNVPAVNAEVSISYGVTKGRAGNGVQPNTIKTPGASLMVGFQTIPLSASHAGTSSGGEDPEDLRAAQANAPKVFATGQRAVTQADYDALLNTFRDPVFGAVARGRAQCIRGIENELTILGLLAGIKTAAESPAAVAAIQMANSNISVLADSNDTYSGEIDDHVVLIQDGQTSIYGIVDDANTEIANANENIATVKQAAKGVPYQQLIGLSNGVEVTFTTTLTKAPVVPGSVAVWVEPMTISATDNAGNCDTVKGVVQTGGNIFALGSVGCLIKIGSEFRRVVRFVAANQVEYSGAVIVGTGYLVKLYTKGYVGFDSPNSTADGAIVGSGITTGSIQYATGTISVQFSAAIPGTNEYGRPVLCAYRYEDAALQAQCDDATGAFANVSTKVADLKSAVQAFDAMLTEITTKTGLVVTNSASLKTNVADSNLALATVQAIASLVAAACDDLAAYLDEVISGDCKANIVQCRLLAHDANGDFIAPTTSLMKAVKNFFESKRVVTVNVSTVSGLSDLLAADIDIKLEILPNYLYAQVWPNAEAAVNALLKDRFYGVHLLESDIWQILVPKTDGTGGITGVKAAAVKILGCNWVDPTVTDAPPVPNIDGDLIITGGQIIVKGTVTYSEVTHPIQS